MKKILSLVLFTTTLCSYSTLFAKDITDLYIDNNRIKTNSYTYQGSRGEVQGKYYMDVLPEIKNNRMYVPVSVITRILGANIEWESPSAIIMYNEIELILAIGKNEVLKNGEIIKLDAIPYISKGRIMVPLRFVSEAFGCDIKYINNRVEVNSPELRINNASITSIEGQYRMSIGSTLFESNSNICINRIYDVLNPQDLDIISEPSLFGPYYNLDVNEFYTLAREYYFKDNNNEVLQGYEIYFQLQFGKDTGIYILRDITNSKWYSFSKEQYYDIIDLENIGIWHIK